jgi:DNA repair exonuclease SbcCD ATPase subunit
MIIFDKIRFRNFLSTGNNFTEINLRETNTTLIIGSNGSGKSTLLDALCFVLFNKAFRKITKNQLINSTNEKECLVEIEFLASNSNWLIRRGIKPAIFEIYRDGKLIDQLASNNDQQDWLEKQVLKLNYKSFTQIVILGSASFVPFMQLSTAHRREIVEDLLDIKIFSSMNSIIREKLKANNEKLKEITISHQMTGEKIEMQKQFIENIEKNIKIQIEEKQNKISDIELKTKKIEEENFSKQNIIENEFQPRLEELSSSTKKIKQLSSIKVKLQEKLSNFDEQKYFFENSSECPTCTQKIDERFRLNKIEECGEKINELENGFKELEKSILEEEKREEKFNKISKKILLINNELSNNNVKISQYNKQTRELQQEIQKLITRNQDKNIERNVLIELEKSFSKLENDRAKYKELNSYYEFAQNLLKDGGVKAKIIQKYLPVMNHQINKYLQMMDFYINFTLDEEFNESIKSPIHEDFSYESFSEGEKMRINLALLFTWREIARIKNSVRTNLLILDEVFDSSLDGTGIEYFSKIIRYVIKDSNILVISHKTDEMIDSFDRVIKVEKIKGFSKIVS